MDRLRPQGDYISKEQFYKEAHISKRKAAELINSGIIPAIDTHRQTRRYWIAREDVDTYLQERILHPEKYGNAHKQKMPCEGVLVEYSRQKAAMMRKRIQEIWTDQPDMLSVKAVSKLLGYDRRTISLWVHEWKVRSIATQNGRLYSKADVIKAIASKRVQKMKFKSKEHVALIRRVINDEAFNN